MGFNSGFKGLKHHEENNQIQTAFIIMMKEYYSDWGFALWLRLFTLRFSTLTEVFYSDWGFVLRGFVLWGSFTLIGVLYSDWGFYSDWSFVLWGSTLRFSTLTEVFYSDVFYSGRGFVLTEVLYSDWGFCILTEVFYSDWGFLLWLRFFTLTEVL